MLKIMSNFHAQKLEKPYFLDKTNPTVGHAPQLTKKKNMQIILLSGGSGKRLWPLSNDTRSKQFLPLLESPEGKSESMVQRVVRQIKESTLEGNITIATNEAQRDIIINQLGDKINFVKEPERRNTFPAIALACSNLSLEKKCNDDEIIIVMPCDTYTETSYFDTVALMVKTLENHPVQLALMGIPPAHASTRYGYIVPETLRSDEQFQWVKYFTEKPNIAQARALLQEGAYWNGGVFAFRLGDMMNKLKQYLKVSTYEDLLLHYSELPAISFDYEVAEKSTDVAVIPFDGTWKDLGTWNSITQELHHESIGNVVLGKKNINTHVINELDLPIFCDGLSNIIVAGSPDGIIVCSKECSENIKTYADRLSKRPMYEERRWGTYQVLKSETYEDGTKYLTKSLKLHAGKFISYQVHRKRKEVWTITEGTGLVVVDDEVRQVGRGDVIVIERLQKHCIKAITELEIIEVQLGTELVESDIERFEWNW